MQMLNTDAVRAAVLAGALMACGAAIASESGTPSAQAAQAIVESTTAAVVGAMDSSEGGTLTRSEELAALVDEHVSPHIDYQRLAALALGRHWRDALPLQQGRFVGQLRQLITRSYSAAVPQLVGAEVDYRKPRISKDGKRIAVRTRVVTTQGNKFDVNYYLYLAGSEWRLYDLSLEGVSLLTTYRRSFAAHMRNGTLDTLIEHMAELNTPS
jgi:phospholipid transport system substrate-binding protein